MNYEIIFTIKAAKDISKLEPEIKEKIGDALKRYGKDPLNYAKKMVEPSLGSYRFRIGDYRVIFDVEGDSATCWSPQGNLPKIVKLEGFNANLRIQSYR